MAGRKKTARACLGLHAGLSLSLSFFACSVVACTKQPVSPDRGQDVAYGALTR